VTALTVDRKQTDQLSYHAVPETLSLKADDELVFFAGAIVCIEAGYAVPGKTATGLIAVGRCEKKLDTTNTAAGDLSVWVREGVFKWGNSTSTDEITQAEVGTLCYVVDDQTVAKTNGSSTRSVAGTVVRVDTDGVFVLMGLARI